MSSFTTWTQIKPQARGEDMAEGLQARVFDPLWLLARQWQLGAFQGEDNGTPISARIRTTTYPISRYYPGQLKDKVSTNGQPYDSRKVPLETLVEREKLRPETNEPRRQYRLEAESGLQFLRILDTSGLGTYRQGFLEQYKLQAINEAELEAGDPDTRRFLMVMSQRAPDGKKLYQAMKEAFKKDQPVFPAAPTIASKDREAFTKAVRSWLDWHNSLFSEPKTPELAWIPERMEYAFAVSGLTPSGEKVLAAPEYQEGHLDWYSFNLLPGASLGAKASEAQAKTKVQTLLPTPVSYRGMPAARWWQFEDADVNFGGIEAEPTDLARLVFLEFALTYGNDCFLIPLELEASGIYNIRSLVVTDTFGRRTLIRPYDQVDGPAAHWRMFCQSDPPAVQKPSEAVFFLPPVLGTSLHSLPVEEVLFIRDEMANLAWAIERIVESPVGRPINRHEQYQEKRRLAKEAAGEQNEQTRQAKHTPMKYKMATTVPDHWLPLLPVKENPDNPSIRLRLGRVLQGGSGNPVLPEPMGRLLELRGQLSLFEEEVPRSGALVTCAYQYTRWTDGSTQLWMGRKKIPGRGEGSSGLRFDVLEGV